MTDYSASILLPQLMRAIYRHSPAVKVSVRHLTAESWFPTLDAGDVDICVGFLSEGDERHLTELLFEDEWVCLRSRRAGEPLRMVDYLAADHVVVGDRLMNHVDRTIRALGVSRKNVVSLPYCLVAPALVEDSRLVLTLPRRLAAEFQRGRRLEVLDLPFAIPKFSVHSMWHARLSQDPGLQWLREVIRQVATEGSARSAAAIGTVRPLRRQ